MFKGSVTEISGKVVSIVINKSLGNRSFPFMHAVVLTVYIVRIITEWLRKTINY